MKILEGSQLSRSRRQAAGNSFIPVQLHGDSNPDPDPAYPRTIPGSEPDYESKHRTHGVPATPQTVRIRGDLAKMNPNEGRVEINIFGVWGLVCGNYFQQAEATLVCHQLGFSHGANRGYLNSEYGKGHYRRQDIILGHLQCKGDADETTLLDCKRKLMPECDLNSTAGIECLNNPGCDFGWSSFDGLCYRLEVKPMTQAEAAADCRAKGGRLAAITSIEEANYITNMMYTRFKSLNALWTGGQYGSYKDLGAASDLGDWTFVDSIQVAKQPLWFPGFEVGQDSRPLGDPKQKSCIALSKLFQNKRTRKDVDTDFFWWDNASCKTKLPYLCQKMATDTAECYNGNGADYRGHVARTDKGTPCQMWSENELVNQDSNPDADVGDHNFCRNPDGDTKPWCWVDNKRNVFGYCSIRSCSAVKPQAQQGPKLEPGFNNPNCPTPQDYFCPSMLSYRPVCVKEAQLCDTFFDCVGKEDEDEAFCRNYTCKSEQFYCKGVHKCISMDRVCDGSQDCDKGDDETTEACQSVKADTEADLEKEYSLIKGVDEKSIPLKAKRALLYKKSVLQCAKHCDRMEQFVCKGFVFYKTDDQQFQSKCFLIDTRIPDAPAKANAASQSKYYELPETCDDPDDFLCNNSKCAKQTDMCNGFDDCGDFSDEINDKCGKDPQLNFEVVLNGGPDNHEGRVEIRLFSQWGLVCDDGLDENMANAICKQLGYHDGVEKFVLNAWQEYGRGSGGYILSGVKCPEGAANLSACTHRPWGDSGACSIKNVAGVVCVVDRPCNLHEVRCDDRCYPLSKICDKSEDCSDGWDESECDHLNLTLTHGHNSSSGMLEVSRGGIQGAICDDHFTAEEIAVACRQLGIPGRGAIAPRGLFKAPAGLVMWVQDIQCKGTEDSLFKCDIKDWGESSCEIEEAVQLVCGLPEITDPAPSKKPLTDFSSVCGKRVTPYGFYRIGGGRDAGVTEVPWQVGIRKKVTRPAGLRAEIKMPTSSAWCGGTILTDRWILSAAHCFPYSNLPKSSFIVRAGDFNNVSPDQYEQEYEIDLLIKHEQYSGPPAYDFDIALLRLSPNSKGFLQFNAGIQPACLPTQGQEMTYDANFKCLISGWGSMGGFDYPEILQYAEVPLIKREVCDVMYEYENITTRMFCAGYEEGGIDACQGDSGGPLVCKITETGKYTVVGVTSFGNGCAEPNAPGVYSHVPYFRNWIDKIMTENS